MDELENRPRVLIVEDERRIIRLLTLSFELAGYVAASAQDGREALASIEAEPPDIMLLDLILPVMDGLELLKALGPERGFPVIALSSNSALRTDAMKLGANAFVSKPFYPETLLTIASALLPK